MTTEELILKYVDILIWPFTILLILFLFRKKVLKLLDRTKKLELPGGITFEIFEEEIQKAKEIAKKVESEKSSNSKKTSKPIRELSTDTEANKRMIELGLKPSPSGLQTSYYQQLTEYDPRLALAVLRMDLEMMLKNLAKGFNIKISVHDSLTKIIGELLRKNAITINQFELINKLIQLTNASMHGIDVSKSQANEIFEIMEILIRYYKAWLSWGFDK